MFNLAADSPLPACVPTSCERRNRRSSSRLSVHPSLQGYSRGSGVCDRFLRCSPGFDDPTSRDSFFDQTGTPESSISPAQ